jgi:site-specific DNA-methyltransferase (adenine-specific)
MSKRIKTIIGNQTLYLGDMFEVVKDIGDKSIDIVCTDPPYLCLEAEIDVEWDKDLNLHAVINEYRRMMKVGSFLIFFGKGDVFFEWNMLAKDFSDLIMDVVWDKKRSASFATPMLRVHESIAIRRRGNGKGINKCYIDAVKRWEQSDEMYKAVEYIKRIQKFAENDPDGLLNYLKNGKVEVQPRKESSNRFYKKNYLTERKLGSYMAVDVFKRGFVEQSIIRIKRDNFYDSHHLTQKPLELMERLLNLVKSAEGGDVVLDSFMGSGTTLIACENLGLRGIGIEKDPEYYETACRRVQNEVSMLKMG